MSDGDALRERLARLSPQQRAALEARLLAGGGPEPIPARPVGEPEPIPARPEGESAPLTPAQRRLWVIDRLDPGNPAYTLSWSYRLTGPVDPDRLAAAFDALVDRHPILSRVIDVIGGEPYLVPGSPPRLELARTDGQDEGTAWLEAAARHRFDLLAAPAVRAGLAASGPDEHLLSLAIHHVIADRWSVAILMRDWLALYQGQDVGPRPVPFTDYAAWQHAQPAAAGLEYWKDTLDGLPEALDLPADRQRPALLGSSGRRLLFDLDQELTGALRAMAAGQRATLFMVVLAGFQALLSRYTGQRDIAVGTPMAARPHPSLDGTAGLFLNTVVLRGDLGGDPAFSELLTRTRGRVIEAFEHAAVPFETLVDELTTGRDLSRNPLFQVLIAFQNTPPLPSGLPGVRMERLDVRQGTAMFDLDLIVEERADGSLLCVLDYSDELFDDARMRRLGDHLRTLLSAAAADPGTRLSQLPIMDEAETRRGLAAARGRELDVPEVGVPALVAAQAERTPHAPAVRDTGLAELTYAELAAGARRLAVRLRELGIGAEKRVGVCLPRTPELVVALLGVLESGACYVPLDPGYPAERLATLLDDSGAELVVTTPELAARLPEGMATTPVAEPGDRDPEPGELPPCHPAQAAYLIYTSGSTGRPKGVTVPHRGLVSLLEDLRERPGLGEGDAWLFLTSVSFDIAMAEVFAPLVSGGTVLVADTGEIGRAQRLIEAGVPHTVQATPSVLSTLVPSLAAGRVARIISTGEALPSALAAKLVGLTGELWDLYGPTETTIWSSGHQVVRPGGSSIGTPVANTAAHVVDANLRLQPIGVPGELVLGGAGVTRGYHGRAGLTADRFVPDPFGPPGGRLYRTGDLVRRHAGGHLEYLGRLDDQVKIRGVRIEPGEISAALATHPGVRQAVVAVRDDAPGGRGLVAYVRGTAQAGELRAHVRARLPEAMVPVAFVRVEVFPTLPSGKLDRSALPAPEAVVQERVHVAPRTPLEAELAGMWRELLARERIGVTDDFFSLGGHSLLALSLVTRLRERFGAEVPLRRVFESPTIAGLAPVVAAAGAAGGPATLPPAGPGPVAPTHAQARLWFLDQLDPGNPAYNVAWAERLTGRLDVDVLVAAFADVVDRHDALRLVIVARDGEPELAECRHRPVLRVHDAASLPPDVGRQEARHRFDLAEGPLVRALLVRHDDHTHDLYLTLHHVAADRWTLSILLRDLMTRYRARLGASGDLPALAAGFRDFAAWHRERAASREADLAYWRQALEGLPGTLDLPSDRQRQGLPTHEGRRLTFRIDAATTTATRSFAAERRATPFMVLAAALQAVLARYTGRDDIPIGTPVSGRTHTAAENLAGLFLNTLVLRGDLSGRPGFGELVLRTRERVLDAHEHAELPFELLVQELAQERDLGRNPLFQVMLAVQNVPPAPPGDAALRLSTLDVDPGVTQADLHLVVEEAGEELVGVLHYATDLFDHDRMERFAGHFRRLLAAALAEPDLPIAELPFVTEPELRLIAAANDTGEPEPPATLAALLAGQAARTPQALALSAPHGGGLSYEEFARRVGGLAALLTEAGVRPGDVVGVCLERGPDLVVAVHAVVAAGAAYLPLEPDHPADRLAGMMADAGARVAISVAAHAVRLPPEAGRVLLDERWPDRPLPELEIHPDALAYVIFTSGSTGRPKGVGVSHRAIVNRLRWMQDTFRLAPDDRVLHKTPFSFDVSVWELFWPLLTGASLTVARPGGHADPGYLAGLMATERITAAHFVPSMLAPFLDEEELPGTLRRVICSGEALGPELAARLHKRLPGAELHNLYGPTEAAVDVSWHACVPGERSVPIGAPITATRLEVLDAAMRRVPVGVPGTLWIGGVQLARGYVGRPGLTAERFLPDPYGPPGARLYDTGDLARWRPDGEIDYLGRADDQVKIRGMRVELGEVEAALRGLPGVAAAAVRAVSDGAGLRLAAYVVPATSHADAGGFSLEALREVLPAHLVPATCTLLDTLPLTRSGKLDRAALPDPRTTRAHAVEYEEPDGAAERAVAEAWCGVLGLERMSAHDNFFAAGGDSIRSLKVLSRLRERGYAVRLEHLFLHQTVRELAGALLPATPAEQPPPTVAAFGLLNPADLARLQEGDAR
ncbi:non-ribosomal peptide synthetase [Nonomuraea soli]|uniref:Amino acid adenylation domain-containing protein n=1 Tax=Nonomuraea soli TaxID=1032476 RepID=A0A7W0HW41_9ACTN|nr:non-ribosomal peptide synthetase [Nonomuraea soli]MBA2897863.1 amino acid adenylation domain-containing protein [Nonomuraea soli]